MDESRLRLVGAAALVGSVVVGGVIGLGGRPEPLPGSPAEAPAPSTASSVATPAEIVVHVAGAVVSPGLVRVASDARVADAVAAAGGVTADAAPDALNLAATLADGSQVVVPTLTAGATGTPVAVDDGLIHVNQADATELEDLPGVGPVLAERIIAHRDDNGPFGSIEDLLDVPGIGESKLSGMRDVIAIP